VVQKRPMGKGLLAPVFVAHVGMSVRGFQPANDPDLEITVVQFGQYVMDRFAALGDQITVTRVKLPPGAGENLEQLFRVEILGLLRDWILHCNSIPESGDDWDPRRPRSSPTNADAAAQATVNWARSAYGPR